jgi:hypothetical protein
MVLALPLSSFAADIHYSYTTSSTLITDSTIFNVPQFNSSLGTLQEVNLVLKLYSTPVLTIQNDGSTSATYTKATSNVNPASATLVSYPGSGPDPLMATSATGKASSKSGSINGNTTLTFDGPQQVDTDTILVTNPDSAFTGGGTIPLTIDLLEGGGTYKGTSLADILFGGGNDLYAMLSIDYIYANCCCIPEPPPVALVFLGLGGLLIGRRFWLRKSLA